MNFITSKEFLNQSKKVQEELLEWWKPQIGDIYCDLRNNQEDNVFVVNECQLNFESFKEDIKEFGVPLLQMHQLIKFIEDKTNGYLDIDCCSPRSEGIRRYDFYIFNSDRKLIFNIEEGNCLLQALWLVAIKLIEDK